MSWRMPDYISKWPFCRDIIGISKCCTCWSNYLGLTNDIKTLAMIIDTQWQVCGAWWPPSKATFMEYGKLLQLPITGCEEAFWDRTGIEESLISSACLASWFQLHSHAIKILYVPTSAPSRIHSTRTQTLKQALNPLCHYFSPSWSRLNPHVLIGFETTFLHCIHPSVHCCIRSLVLRLPLLRTRELSLWLSKVRDRSEDMPDGSSGCIVRTTEPLQDSKPSMILRFQDMGSHMSAPKNPSHWDSMQEAIKNFYCSIT